MFGADANEPTTFLHADATAATTATTLTPETLGVSASDARKLRALLESDLDAHARETERFREKYESNKEHLQNRTSTEPVYSPEAKKAMDELERSPADGVLKTAVEVVAASDTYNNAPSKPAPLDFSVPQSQADAQRFLNATFNVKYAASVWRNILLYGVPVAVVNKLFANKKKKDHFEISDPEGEHHAEEGRQQQLRVPEERPLRPRHRHYPRLLPAVQRRAGGAAARADRGAGYGGGRCHQRQGAARRHRDVPHA